MPLLTYAEPDYGDASWPHGLTLTFGIVGVFQIVALQLLALVAGGRGFAQCSHCGAPFALTGHREGKRRFCTTCITGKVPLRYAARDYRGRKNRRRTHSR